MADRASERGQSLFSFTRSATPRRHLKSTVAKTDPCEVLLSSPTVFFAAVAAILLWTVFGCLKTIAHQYEQAVAWHNLKVEAHRLRLQQQRRLESLLRRGSRISLPPRTHGRAEPAEIEAEIIEEVTPLDDPLAAGAPDAQPRAGVEFARAA